MDKMKGVVKGGWHPSGDRKITRENWKSDIKGSFTGKKDPHLDNARNHQSAPLSSLKDPALFAPPPKSIAYHGEAAASPSTPTSTGQLALPAPAQPGTRPVPQPAARPVPTPAAASRPTPGGLGAPVPVSSRRREQEQEAEEPPAPPQPYRVDTSGLRTDHLPKPPLRRLNGDTPPPPAAARGPPPGLPSRQTPTLPARQNPTPPARQIGGPPPVLPPRQNEYPDEHTPPAPPPYSATPSQPAQNPVSINAGAANRLAQAGVNVPGFNITSQAETPAKPSGPSGPQLSELQQRFARMGTGNNNSSPSQPGLAQASSTATNTIAAAAAAKKAPPPPPAKKAALSTGNPPQPQAPATGAPPPLPLASKPRPT